MGAADVTTYVDDMRARHQGRTAARELCIVFEVLSLRQGRWVSCNLLCRSEGKSMSLARDLAEKSGCEGVRVVKNTFDPETGIVVGEVVFSR